MVPASLLRHSLARAALRQQQRFATSHPRFASSTSEATQKKAQDALATAQKTAGQFLEGAKKFLEPVGHRVGQLLGSYKQPLLYNLAVTKEVIKLVYVREGLAPPNLATFRSVYSSLWSQVTSPGLMRNLVQSGDVGRVGIYGLQAYGIFKIGEIVGRRSMIGYSLDD
ncbi:mitochondrial ATP synthase g subunit-domain-containing protein [Crassisporium funariophilum]|nr:mitochondrial ATP synthase g subunit-domain-containing protein [Crassisporium funariophilum]